MIEALDWAAGIYALLAVVIGVPVLYRANGHSRIVLGLIVIAIGSVVARADSLLLETRYLRAVGSLMISTAVLALVVGRAVEIWRPLWFKRGRDRID